MRVHPDKNHGCAESFQVCLFFIEFVLKTFFILVSLDENRPSEYDVGRENDVESH